MNFRTETILVKYYKKGAWDVYWYKIVGIELMHLYSGYMGKGFYK